MRIPCPSCILQALSKPEHPRIPTDSSSQHDFVSSSTATTSTDSYGFQLPAPFWKVHQSHNIHGVLRIPAPSMVLQALTQPQHPRIPTDSSSQQHPGTLRKAPAYQQGQLPHAILARQCLQGLAFQYHWAGLCFRVRCNLGCWGKGTVALRTSIAHGHAAYIFAGIPSVRPAMKPLVATRTQVVSSFPVV